jgi:hypothetical protein
MCLVAVGSVGDTAVAEPSGGAGTACVDLRLTADQAEVQGPARERLAYPRAVPTWLMAAGAGLITGVGLLYALEPMAAQPYLGGTGVEAAMLAGLGVGATSLLIGLGLAASNHVVASHEHPALQPTVVVGPHGSALGLAGGF